MKRIFLAAMAALLSTVALAQSEAPDNLRDRLAELLGDRLPISAIAETGFPGIFEVTAGSRVLYAGLQGDLLLVGNLFDVERGVNIGEEKQNEVAARIAKEQVGQVPMDQMIVFKGEETKRYITVFTDVECGYCRRLHQEVPELNAAGIEIRYLMFPVISERSLPNAVSVWCAEDQQDALTQAKRGNRIEELSCENPVEEHLEIGRKMGVRGTPFLVFDDYTVVPGYVPAKELISQLGL